MSILSDEQEEQVDALIKQIQPETTVFVALMKPGNVKTRGPNLVIPSAYAAVHFPHKNQVVTLQRPGKSKKWHPRLNVRKDKSCHMLMGPWSHFVQDNHVQEGDICIFQPLKTAGVRFTLMVHLIHQSKVGTLLHDEKNGNSPSPAGGTSSSRGKTMRSKANDLKIVHSTDGKAKAEVTPIARVKEEPADPGPSNSKGYWTDDESDDSGGPSEAGLYILSAHAHLADEQRKKVEDIVGSIQCQVPIYVAVMNKTSVAVNGTCVLYFGKQYTSKYLPHGEHTVTLVRNGNSAAWKVKMHAQMFSKGWRDFVRDNRLKLDDICLFQLTKDDIKMLTMTVYIIRHV
ncbi:B3 domain-containing protein Os03g0620400-like isoform X2 [Miscanthus floridulus]